MVEIASSSISVIFSFILGWGVLQQFLVFGKSQAEEEKVGCFI